MSLFIDFEQIKGFFVLLSLKLSVAQCSRVWWELLHTLAYVSIRHHTSAYVSIHQYTSADARDPKEKVIHLNLCPKFGQILRSLTRFDKSWVYHPVQTNLRVSPASDITQFCNFVLSDWSTRSSWKHNSFKFLHIRHDVIILVCLSTCGPILPMSSIVVGQWMHIGWYNHHIHRQYEPCQIYKWLNKSLDSTTIMKSQCMSVTHKIWFVCANKNQDFTHSLLPLTKLSPPFHFPLLRYHVPPQTQSVN